MRAKEARRTRACGRQAESIFGFVQSGIRRFEAIHAFSPTVGHVPMDAATHRDHGHFLQIRKHNRRCAMIEFQDKQVVEYEQLDRNLDPLTGAPGSHPVGTSIGAVGGMTAGILVGSVGGPIGTAVGGVVGTVVGGLAGSGIGEAINPTAEEMLFGELIARQTSTQHELGGYELYWQRAFITEPYYDPDLNYDDYAPAYRAGIVDRLGQNRSWDEAESDLQTLWNRFKGASRLSWDEARQAMQAAWYHTNNALAQQNQNLYGLH
jgi:hypothetical protein